MKKKLSGWGRTAPTTVHVVAPRSVEDVVAAVTAEWSNGVIARGAGHSYGDPAQNTGGLVLDMTGLARIHQIDPDRCVVDLDAGVSIGTLITTALPYGLWVPVSPGARQVTVGGAIAADVHGKNHHKKGSFGNHVVDLDLVTADGTVHTLTPEGVGAELFWATVGGMGLTGIVVRARIRLHRTESAYFIVDTERVANLDELFTRLTDGSDEPYEHSAAWFDTNARGARLGRAVLSRGSLARRDELPRALREDPLQLNAPRALRLPNLFPNGLANRVTLRAFSEFWYRSAPRSRQGAVQNVTAFYHVSDRLKNWNRLYGSRGFIQYQFAVPLGAEDTIRSVVEHISMSDHASGLSVLKQLGPSNPAPLSFPIHGWTATADFPVTSGLNRLCDELDELVLAAGGRHYLAKDSRATETTIHRGYPRLDDWRKVRHLIDPAGVFVSDMARRLKLNEFSISS